MLNWQEMTHSAFDDKLGLEVLELTPQRVRGRAPVAGNTQPIGLWHGGATATMMETLGSLGAVAHGHPDRFAVGVDLNVTHHRSVRQGWVHGEATAIHLGRTSTCHEIVLTDDDGQRAATGRLTCRLVGMDGNPVQR